MQDIAKDLLTEVFTLGFKKGLEAWCFDDERLFWMDLEMLVEKLWKWTKMWTEGDEWLRKAYNVLFDLYYNWFINEYLDKTIQVLQTKKFSIQRKKSKKLTKLYKRI